MTEKLADVELMEIELTDKERRALKMRADGAAYSTISLTLFDSDMTRQGTYEFVKQAERKQWRLNARQRYEGRLESCPIEELPVSGRMRAALLAEGYAKVGQIAGMSREDLAKIPGVGRRHGSFILYALLQSWEVKKPGAFCPGCGSAVARKRGDEISCSECGQKTKLKVTAPPALEVATA